MLQYQCRITVQDGYHRCVKACSVINPVGISEKSLLIDDYIYIPLFQDVVIEVYIFIGSRLLIRQIDTPPLQNLESHCNVSSAAVLQHGALFYLNDCREFL